MRRNHGYTMFFFHFLSPHQTINRNDIQGRTKIVIVECQTTSSIGFVRGITQVNHLSLYCGIPYLPRI